MPQPASRPARDPALGGDARRPAAGWLGVVGLAPDASRSMSLPRLLLRLDRRTWGACVCVSRRPPPLAVHVGSPVKSTSRRSQQQQRVQTTSTHQQPPHDRHGRCACMADCSSLASAARRRCGGLACLTRFSSPLLLLLLLVVVVAEHDGPEEGDQGVPSRYQRQVRREEEGERPRELQATGCSLNRCRRSHLCSLAPVCRQ